MPPRRLIPISLFRFRRQLGEALDTVLSGEVLALERHGRTIAYVLPVRSLPELRELLGEVLAQPDGQGEGKGGTDA